MSDGLTAVLARMAEIRAAFGTNRTAAPLGATASSQGFDDALRAASNPTGASATKTAGAAKTAPSPSSSRSAAVSGTGRAASTLATTAAGRTKARTSGPATAATWPEGVPEAAKQYADAYVAASQATGVPLEVLLAVSWAESAFNADAVSPVGAQGLMQLMPATAAALGVDAADPAQNILGGARYLAQQYAAFGSWDLAFAAYNAGPGAVQRYGGVPPYAETQSYVQIIDGYLGRVRAANPATAPAAPASVPAPSASAAAPASASASASANLAQQLAAVAVAGPAAASSGGAAVPSPARAVDSEAGSGLNPIDGGPLAARAATSVPTGAAVALAGPASSPDAAPLGPQALPERLVALVQRAREGGQASHRLTVRLDPPQLGNVSVLIELRGGDVNVSMRTERGDAASLLAAQRDRVSAVLQREGFNLSGFDVRADSGNDGTREDRRPWASATRVTAIADLEPANDLLLAFDRELRL